MPKCWKYVLYFSREEIKHIRAMGKSTIEFDRFRASKPAILVKMSDGSSKLALIYRILKCTQWLAQETGNKHGRNYNFIFNVT